MGRFRGHNLFLRNFILISFALLRLFVSFLRLFLRLFSGLAHGEQLQIKISGSIFTLLCRAYTQIFWGVDRNVPRSEMRKCNFPVLDQLLVQFGQIWTNLDKFLSETVKLQFLITDLGIFLSAPQKFF